MIKPARGLKEKCKVFKSRESFFWFSYLPLEKAKSYIL